MPDGSNATAKLQPSPQDPSMETPAKVTDPLHEVVTLLNRVAAESKLALLDPDLAGMVGKLAEQATEPGRLDQPSYRTGAAYAVQDMEKYTGGQPIAMPAELRAELVTLASTSPGLQDGRMQGLVAKTSELEDRELILDIRRTAQQVVRLDPHQDGSEMTAKIEALEKRAGIVRSPEVSTTNDAPALQVRQDVAMPTGQDKPAEQAVAVEASDAGSKAPTAKEPGTPAGAGSIEQRVNAVPSPGSGQTQAAATVGAAEPARPAAATTQPATNTPAGQARRQTEAAQTQGVAERIISSTRSPRSLDPAPWSVPVPAIGQRIAQFEQRLADGKTERLVQSAEKSGNAMLAAMEQFTNGPGRDIMSKLEVAATRDPGGMPAVIGEMRPGGRHAAERAEFDAALRTPAVGNAYKAITESADKFAEDRHAVAKNLRGRKLDPAAADGRFEQLDAAAGEQASKLPGREAGKDAVAEMAQKLAELLRKAMAKVEQAFSKTTGVEAQATARPSPSPGASM